jgi:N-acetylneuraminic acid mutarotase
MVAGNYTTFKGEGYPGSRKGAHMSIFSDDSIMMFGGEGSDSTGNKGPLNDMWIFYSQSQKWYWIGGNNTATKQGIYNSLYSEGYPGSRYNYQMVSLANQSVVMFGGVGYDSKPPSIVEYLNDFWRYDPFPAQKWFWIGGESIVKNKGLYNSLWSQGYPGPRDSFSMVSHPNGSVYMFGGVGYASDNTTMGQLNDFWRYDTMTMIWFWIGGNATVNSPESKLYPSSRIGATLNVISNMSIILFGGLNGNTPLNDFWTFIPRCSCFKGTCSEYSGGKCSVCEENYAGPFCTKQCSCYYGTCDGVNGDGRCASCLGDYSGEYCNIGCLCINGTCNSGVNGSQSCVADSCFKGYAGEYCNISLAATDPSSSSTQSSSQASNTQSTSTQSTSTQASSNQATEDTSSSSIRILYYVINIVCIILLQ